MAEPTSIITTATTAATVKAVDNALEKAAAGISRYLASVGSSMRDKAIVDFRIGFRPFLQATYERCRTFKTLLNPYTPLSVVESYINVTIQIGDRKFPDSKVISGIVSNSRLAILGLAGSGKSMLMKYLALNTFDNDPSRVPLFVELRRFRSSVHGSLEEFILSSVSTDKVSITRDQFDLGIKSGIFSIILDGFDEVNEEESKVLEELILEFERFHPDTPIVVSSRPSRRFEAWEKFYICQVLPLDKVQSVALIKSLKYDDDVKNRFLKNVEESLWKSHESFLSSPLLCTIMLLTYEEFAEIPTKMHSFYSQAFDTLFQRHDALKAQFVRETRTGFTKDSFKRCLSAFCVTSYLDEKYSFSEEAAVRYADASIKYVKQSSDLSNKQAKGEDFVHDLIQSICILQPEGIDLAFVHRSFQEYFSALFAANYHDEKFPELLDKFARRFADAAVAMAFDMAREKVESEWTEPRISHLLENLSPRVPLHERVSSVYGGLTLMKHRNEGIYVYAEFETSNFGLLYCIGRLYPGLLGFRSWFKPVDRMVRLEKLAAYNANNIIEGDVDLQGWLSTVPPDGQRAPRFTLQLNDQADELLHGLGFHAAFDRFQERGPKILSQIGRRERGRSSVIDQFL